MAGSGVKTAKKLIETALHSKTEPWLAILAQRNTPSEGMLTSPAQRLFAHQTKGWNSCLQAVCGDFTLSICLLVHTLKLLSFFVNLGKFLFVKTSLFKSGALHENAL